MSNSSIPDFASDDARFEEQAAKFDVLPHDQSNGASVTEGWADSHGNPAHHQVDFIENEQIALNLSKSSTVPDDQKKSFSVVAVIAIVFFIAAVAGVWIFVGLR